MKFNKIRRCIKMRRIVTLSVILFCIQFGLYAQSNTGTITGIIQNQEGEPVDHAYVSLSDTRHYTQTDEEGKYSLTAPSGEYQLLVTRIGYERESIEIILRTDEEKELNITLNADSEMALEEVIVFGKSEAQEVNETAFNVQAVDIRALHNTTMDLSQTLDRVSGVKIRQSGGVGSNTSVSLNGFSGRHVKFFLDGIPMEGYGPAFQMNNIPVNMAKRIEVYKGVVPINFGSDALGGAINIVTNDQANTFLDASYSYGSFNTHKSYINTGYTSERGFTASLNAYQNYSDNNYWVNAKVLDLDRNIFDQDRREVRRFHDMYHNEAIIAKAGVVRKPFADRLLLGFTLGNEFKEIQHPADMSFVYGKRHREAGTLIPSLLYKKNDLFTENLNASLNAYYNFGEATRVDTARVRYNWLGESIDRDRRGELSYSFYEYRNRNSAATANITYTLFDKHAITINNSFTGFSRKGRDKAAPSATDDHPSETFKNVVGVGYKFKYSDRWNTSLFLKHYINTVGSYADPDGGNDYQHYRITTKNTGYGIASTFFITNDLQIKASYEQTYRLPTGRELFGSGDGIEVGNVSLNPENSDNVNLGFNYNTILNHIHGLNISTNFIYREIKDYIRREISPSRGTAGSVNEGLVINKGIDAELRYSYKTLFTVGGNITYQDIRNKLKYRNNSTVESTIYNDRVPNVPYLYGNVDVTFIFHDPFRSRDKLSLGYNLRYVHEFYYDWQSYGGITIPTQLSHDISATYNLQNGRYNITAEARNITDENLFDNYSLQKPGRSFSIKLRYFIN